MYQRGGARKQWKKVRIQEGRIEKFEIGSHKFRLSVRKKGNERNENNEVNPKLS